MLLHLNTISTTTQSTLGTLHRDGAFQCFTLEDPWHPEKIDGDTRIPAGRYRLELRTEGKLHQRYAKRFAPMHQGMIWIRDIPDYEWVYIHCGNMVKDTQGCPLVGDTAHENITRDGFVGSSVAAYERIYPPIVDGIERGDAWILVSRMS